MMIKVKRVSGQRLVVLVVASLKMRQWRKLPTIGMEKFSCIENREKGVEIKNENGKKNTEEVARLRVVHERIELNSILELHFSSPNNGYNFMNSVN